MIERITYKTSLLQHIHRVLGGDHVEAALDHREAVVLALRPHDQMALVDWHLNEPDVQGSGVAHAFDEKELADLGVASEEVVQQDLIALTDVTRAEVLDLQGVAGGALHDLA